MGLVEYPHPSRWIHKAVTSDRNRTQLVVNEDLLNEDQIKELMLQFTSRIPGIDPTMRLLVLPHRLTGTAMPRMINTDPYRTPTPQQSKPTGLLLILLCENPHCQHLVTVHPEPVPCMITLSSTPTPPADQSNHTIYMGS